MGVIKGIFIVLFSTLLIISLFSNILSFSLSNSLSYKSLGSNSQDLVKQFLEESDFFFALEENLPAIENYCLNNTGYSFDLESLTVDIPCETVFLGKEEIKKKFVEDITHQVYYKEYGCEFIDCFKQNEAPLFLLSEKAHTFVKNCFYITLATSLGLIFVIFLLLKKKSNIFILTGALLLPPSLFFFRLNLSSLIKNETFLKIANVFFSGFYNLSIKTMILGGILIIIGIAFKISKVGGKILSFFEKFKKKEKPKKTEKPKEPEKRKEPDLKK